MIGVPVHIVMLQLYSSIPLGFWLISPDLHLKLAVYISLSATGGSGEHAEAEDNAGDFVCR